MNNTIVYLMGHYGAGKYTVGKAICAVTNARLLDNHLINNVVFALIRQDGKTPMPERVWDLIWTIREQAITTIAELAPPEQSYVLTNALRDGDPWDQAAYDQVVALAAQRGNVFVPVILTASDEAFAQRIPMPEREERLKQTDAQGAVLVRATRPLLRVEHPNRLDLDTTDLPPDQAAAIIIAHAERLA